MSESIIHGDMKGKCFMCRRVCGTEKHHIFGGANRSRADADGLTVYLCHYCHNEPPVGVHHNKLNATRLKRIGQRHWMRHYDKTVDEFIQAYGRNYLD